MADGKGEDQAEEAQGQGEVGRGQEEEVSAADPDSSKPLVRQPHSASGFGVPGDWRDGLYNDLPKKHKSKKGGGAGKRKASSEFLKAGKAWRAHLAEYRRKNPNKSLKQQMKGASKTYKKGTSGSSKSSDSWKGFSKYEIRRKPKRSSSKKKSKKRSRRRSTGWLW